MTGPRDTLLDPFLEEVTADPTEVEAFVGLVEGLGAQAPPARAKDRLLNASRLPGRFDRFARIVADLLDVPLDIARGMLDGIEEPARWKPSLMPGMSHHDLTGGPGVRDAITGFVRLPAGSQFPHHRHLGDEHVLVIQGHYVDLEDSTEVGPGEVAHHGPDTAHGLSIVEGGPDLLYLIVAHGGVEIGGDILRPGDPRI